MIFCNKGCSICKFGTEDTFPPEGDVSCWIMILDGDVSDDTGDVDDDMVLVFSEAWGIVQRRTIGWAVCGAVVPTKGSKT